MRAINLPLLWQRKTQLNESRKEKSGRTCIRCSIFPFCRLLCGNEKYRLVYLSDKNDNIDTQSIGNIRIFADFNFCCWANRPGAANTSHTKKCTGRLSGKKPVILNSRLCLMSISVTRSRSVLSRME